MDTNSKSKNKLRIFIAIVMMLLITAGTVCALWYITASIDVTYGIKDVTGYLKRYAYFGDHMYVSYVKWIDGQKIVVFASRNNYMEPYGEAAQFLADYGLLILLALMTLFMVLLVLFLRSKRIWKQTETMKRKSIWYVAEAEVVALSAFPLVYSSFFEYMEIFPAL